MKKNKKRITMKRVENLGHDQMAYALCLFGSVEEIKAGSSSTREVAFSHSSRGVVAVDAKGRSIGVIAWDKQSWKAGCFIAQSYVVPEMRRKGIYSAMYKELVRWAKKEGCVSIASGILPGDERMLALVKKQGRKIWCEVWEVAI